MYFKRIIIIKGVVKLKLPSEAQPLLHKCKNYIRTAQPENGRIFQETKRERLSKLAIL